MEQSVADAPADEPPPTTLRVVAPPHEGEGVPTAARAGFSNAARSPLDWSLVRIDFEGDEKTSWAICREYGIHPAVLARHAKMAKWTTRHRDAGLDRTILIQMLFGVLDREISKLETSDMTETADKTASALGRLTTNMERLIELENRAGTGSTPEQTKEMQDIRRKLARRINRLAKR